MSKWFRIALAAFLVILCNYTALASGERATPVAESTVYDPYARLKNPEQNYLKIIEEILLRLGPADEVLEKMSRNRAIQILTGNIFDITYFSFLIEHKHRGFCFRQNELDYEDFSEAMAVLRIERFAYYQFISEFCNTKIYLRYNASEKSLRIVFLINSYKPLTYKNNFLLRSINGYNSVEAIIEIVGSKLSQQEFKFESKNRALALLK